MAQRAKKYQAVERLEWKPSFSVGYRAMDRQHQILFDVINDLVDAQKNPLSDQALAKIMNELQAYSDAHFKAEEKLMKLMDYPKLETHSIAHLQYREKIDDLKARVGKEEERIDLELLHFLHNWWTSHVLEVDQGYARQE